MTEYEFPLATLRTVRLADEHTPDDEFTFDCSERLQWDGEWDPALVDATDE